MPTEEGKEKEKHWQCLRARNWHIIFEHSCSQQWGWILQPTNKMGSWPGGEVCPASSSATQLAPNTCVCLIMGYTSQKVMVYHSVQHQSSQRLVGKPQFPNINATCGYSSWTPHDLGGWCWCFPFNSVGCFEGYNWTISRKLFFLTSQIWRFKLIVNA